MDLAITDQQPISSTQAVIDHIALHGLKPTSDEPEGRHPPDIDALVGLAEHVMGAFAGIAEGTLLEDDLSELLWSLTHVFHRRLGLLERRLDDNEARQRTLASEQDGSEVKSVELERALNDGERLMERRDAFEALRDAAANEHAMLTGSPWLPRPGSRTSFAKLTSAVIDSRDFRVAKRDRENAARCPNGTRIGFAGGTDVINHHAIFSVLDRARAKHPDMILLHGGSPRGAERIAAKWADAKAVPQVVYRPDWANDGKAAPFKRNDALLEELPVGVIAFPGSGITENLVDKARKLGIPVMRPPRR
ncbi:MAG: DUF2493 domain-containing protein [Pseudomonadota bacterium]